MMKLMITGRRGGMTVAQLHRYMVDTHGAMVVRLIGEQPELTPRRYVQNHVFDASTRAPARAEPLSASRDFVTQVWFDDPAQAKASVEAPFYLEHLQPDEDRFVDQSSVLKLPVIEQQAFGDEGATGSCKLFAFHQAAAGVSVDELAAATLALWEPLLGDATQRIARLVRNRVMSRPGDSAAADLVDEAWLPDEEATRALGERWQAAFEDGRLADSMAPGSGFVLLARERVLFAGHGA